MLSPSRVWMRWRSDLVKGQGRTGSGRVTSKGQSADRCRSGGINPVWLQCSEWGREQWLKNWAGVKWRRAWQPQWVPAGNLNFGLSMKGISEVGIEKRGCHDLICMLKRLIWLLGYEKVNREAALQAEMTEVAMKVWGVTRLGSPCWWTGCRRGRVKLNFRLGPEQFGEWRHH